MSYKRFVLENHKFNVSSIETMSEIQNSILDINIDKIDIDLCKYKYIDPSFAVIIASSLYLGKLHNKEVTILYDPKNSKSLEFLFVSGIKEHFDINSVYNKDGITLGTNRIPFRQFTKIDETMETVNDILSKAPVILSDGLRNDLLSKIIEIFTNAFIHGKSEIGVFCCGYADEQNDFSFSVYDVGIGICKNVNNYLLGEKLLPQQAIEWAFKKGNSTLIEKCDYPRGLGLHLLEKFIIINEGVINLISDNIYYKINKYEKNFEKLKFPLVGTMFSMKIKNDKDCIYTYKV